MRIKESIEWVCLIVEGIIFFYMYYNYKKNKHTDSEKVLISKKNVRIIISLLVIVNIILIVTKIIKILNN
jgi:uncharacterized membrane protein